jgi:hypothetical protein
MRKYNIAIIVFSFDFESEMCRLVPLCVHKKECAWKKYELNFGVSLKLCFNILVTIFWKLFHLFFQVITFLYYTFLMF